MHTFPILALDIGSQVTRALYYPQGMANETPLSIIFASLEYALSEKIRKSTLANKALHISGTGFGHLLTAAMHEHLAKGLSLTMEEKDAKAFLSSILPLKESDIGLTASAPDDCDLVTLSEYDWDYCKQFFKRQLPTPEVVLVSARETGHVPVEPYSETSILLRSLFKQNIVKNRSGGLPLDSLLADALPDDVLRLSAIQRITKSPVADHSSSFILGMMTVPGLVERSFREGIVLVYAGTREVSAALFFQGKIWGFLILPLAAVITDPDKLDNLFNILDDYRLGWLPHERVSSLGGYISRLPELPSEAEGFSPVYATGPNAAILSGKVRLIEVDDYCNCRGLMEGYSAFCQT